MNLWPSPPTLEAKDCADDGSLVFQFERLRRLQQEPEIMPRPWGHVVVVGSDGKLHDFSGPTPTKTATR